MTRIKVTDGIEREILSVGKNLMNVKFEFKKGSETVFHTHEHEQSSYIERGCLKLIINDEEIILTEGMSFIIPSNARHKAIALAEAIDINAFTPVREDYLDKK